MKRQDDQMIAGWHAVLAALRKPEGAVAEIWLRQGREDKRGTELLQLARDLDVPVRASLRPVRRA